MFKSLRERLAGWKEKAEAEGTSEAIGDSGRKIKEGKLEEILYDLEIALLESDVAFPVAKGIVARLAEALRGKRISREVSLERASRPHCGPRSRRRCRSRRSTSSASSRKARGHSS